MIGSLRPYPKYKNLDENWVPRFPAHWDAVPNRALFSEVQERNRDGDEMLSVTIARGVIRQSTLLENSSKKDSSRIDRSAYKRVSPGDIAYNKMRAWQGAIGVSQYAGIVSPAYIVMRPRVGGMGPYFHSLFRTPMFANEAEKWSYGISSDMWSLRPEHFRLIVSPVPPPDEQASIVRFLNYATRRIDRVIRAKKKLIALLNEQKQAIIHRAVTRGLDPSVPLKDSGISWLGQIPAHWEVRRLKDVGSLQSGIGFPPNLQGRVDKELSFYKVADLARSFDGVRMPAAMHTITREEANDIGARIVPPNAVVYAKIGAAMLLNRRRLTYEHCCIDNNMTAYVPKSSHCSFAWAHLWMTILDFGALANSGTVPFLPEGVQGSLPIALPPMEEQRGITLQCESALTEVRTLTETEVQSVSLLAEYRTRLISDVVTGQVDVRGLQIPDEPEGSDEPLDDEDEDESTDEPTEDSDGE